MRKDKRLLLFLMLVLAGALLFSAVPAWAGDNHGRGKSLTEARETLEQDLLPLAGIGFVGIAHSEPEGEITVFVENEQARGRVPRSFEGYPVRTEVTGKIRALSAPVVEPLAGVSHERRDEVRPLVGGTSLSAYVPDFYYAGTLGMVTYDDKILSNAHVIAMEPDSTEFLAIGTAILQPGSIDGGGIGDRVGELQAYIPISFDRAVQNYADAAIASIDGGIEASAGEQFSEQGNYWVEAWTEVSTGDIVRKSGRTTGVTTGEVIYSNFSVLVEYGTQSAYFVDQIVVAQDNYSFAKPGDSGSAVDKGGEFVGLLFAGSSDRAIICKAERIIDGLGIAVEPQPGQYSLTVSSTAGGSVISPGEGRFIYDSGETVDLVAVPDEHYHFVEWTGDVGTVGNVAAAETTIIVNGNYEITASFELDPDWYSLAICGTEGGSVITPGEGEFIYYTGEVVNLVAVPDEHYHFGEWTGDVSTVGNVTAAETTLIMYASYSITASFDLDEGWYSLTTSSTDGGSVATPGEGTYIYGANTSVSLVAVPDESCQFLRWTGDVSTVADVYVATTTIAMNSSYSVTANFESPHPEPTAQLTVSSTEGGSVATPGEGVFPYPLGTDVVLVAEAVSGYQFLNWSGDVGTIADVTAISTTITMDNSYDVRANFSGGGVCFIATAAYGTPMAEEIGILREFRDEYLLTGTLGRAMVAIYYRVSPPIAEFIAEHPSLKPVVRAGLLPAVAMSALIVNNTAVEKIAMAVLLAMTSVAVVIWLMRRRGKDPQYA